VPIEFDPEEHAYTLHGERLPSVTEVIRLLYDFNPTDSVALEQNRHFGTAVHMATSFHDQGTLEEDTVSKPVAEFLTSWRAFVRDSQVEFIEIERPVYHRKLMYAGTPDRVARIEGKVWVLDLKTGATLHPASAIQLSAYLQAYNSSEEISKRDMAEGRLSVQLTRKGYKLNDWRSPVDWPTFIACLQIHNWKWK